MEKNTIIAIVLSGLVLIGSFFVQSFYFAPKQQAAQQARAEQMQIEEKIRAEEAEKQNQIFEAAVHETEKEEAVKEEKITITTKKVQVEFTNRGGDVVSYKILEHNDKDTGTGVEMVDNITSDNRAFAVSFGSADSKIINDIFNYSVKDDNTVLFYRDYEIKNEDGSVQKFTIGKRYTFVEDEYVFKLEVSVIGKDGAALNVGNCAYSLRTSPQIGPHWNKKDRYDNRQIIASEGSKKFRKMISDKIYDRSYEWAGIAGKYFTMIIKPEDVSVMNNSIKVTTKSSSDYDNSQVILTRKGTNSSNINDTYYIYVGPRQEKELIKYNDQNKNAWNLSNSKLNNALQTSGMLSWIEIALKWCMEMIHKGLLKMGVSNWGVPIIILTIILKFILFPLNKKQAVGSLKMQELQPKMQELQNKYGNDQQKLGVEMQKLYKQAGYNPMSGCLPMVIQMFILFAMYNVFNNYFEFRGAHFVTGWIDDLSRGDSILSWEKNIPLISGFTQNNLRLLPIIYTCSQLLSGKITQYGSPAAAGQSQAQMKFMMYGMPIMFFFMFYNVPAGLLLYWTTSNTLQIGQQLVINKVVKAKRAEMDSKVPVNKNAEKFKNGKKRSR